MLDVEDGFVEEHRDVGIVKGIDDLAPMAFSVDEPEVSEDSELVGDGRCLHLDGCRELVDGAGSVAEAGEDANAARCREGLHQLGDLRRARLIDFRSPRVSTDSVTHASTLAE